MKHHFMKQGDNASKGNKYYDSSFLFSINRFQSFFVSKMSVEESLVEKLQRQFRKKLQKLKEEYERLKKQKKFANTLPL